MVRLQNKTAILIISAGGILCATIGVGFLWHETARRQAESAVEAPHKPVIYNQKAATGLSATPVVTSPGSREWNLALIKQAMAECDSAAARNPNRLYFLVVPVRPNTLDAAVPLVPPSVDRYGSFFLVQSGAILDGIKRNYLEISSRPYEFSIFDANTKHIKKGGVAKGVTEFIDQNATAVEIFKMGFSFQDDRLEWSAQYERRKGACFWVNLRFAEQPYSPSYGTFDRGKFINFPSSAPTLQCANYVCEQIPAILSRPYRGHAAKAGTSTSGAGGL